MEISCWEGTMAMLVLPC